MSREILLRAFTGKNKMRGRCVWERTISMMVGKGSLNHNNRTFTAKNVDAERSKANKVYVKENIKKVYHTLFDKALEAYNAKQSRPQD